MTRHDHVDERADRAMPNFCGYCGAGNEGGRFCTTCGRPLHEAEQPVSDPDVEATRARDPQPVPPSPAPTPTQSFASQPAPQVPSQPAPSPAPQPAWTPPPSAYPPQAYAPQGYPSQGHAPARPANPAVNPFAGVPIGDYVRDALAVFFLFATLALRWDVHGDGSDRWWVVLAVLISVASLVVPYVVKSRVVPGWTPQHSRIIKLAAGVPFLASVAAAIVNELVNVTELFEGGLGIGIATGLFGAVLAMQPRQADEDPHHREDRGWNVAASVAAVGAVALGVLTFVAFFLDDLLDDARLLDDVLPFVALVLSAPVMLIVVLGWPAAAALGGDAPWRRVFAASAITVVVAALLSRADDGDSLVAALEVERWNYPTGGTFLVGAAAALAISRPQQRLSRGEPVLGWVRTAGAALNVSGVAFLVTAVATALMMLQNDVEPAPIVIIVLLLVCGVAAIAAASMLNDVRRNLRAVLALAAGLLLVAIITVAVAKAQDVDTGFLAYGVSVYAAAAFFGLPVLAVYALTAPREVRQALGPLFPETPAYPGQAAGQQPGLPQDQAQHYPQGYPQGYAQPGQPPYPQPGPPPQQP